MRLSDSELGAFLQERHTVIVATLREDGTPHLATVWYRWDGTAFWIATNRTTMKYRNLVRDPRIGLIVDDPVGERATAAYGRAEIAAIGDAAWDGALAIVRRYVDDPVAYLEERRADPRALIRVVPDEVVSWKP